MNIEQKLNEYAPVVGFVCPAEFWPALGYGGEARYVAVWWEQCGDEASYSDGRSSLVGADWPAYLALIESNFPLGHPANWLLGGSDTQASMWLIIDRVTEWAWLVPVEEAKAVLRMQHSPMPHPAMAESVAISVEELIPIMDGMTAAVPVHFSDEDFARVMAEQHERDAAFRRALEGRGRVGRKLEE